jgi:site-specific DNA-methyltransferase (adenine-specific)
MEYLCKLITPFDGIVLDPFIGSGSTAIAAKACGFQFVGFEKNPEYVEIAEKRLSKPIQMRL